MTEKAHGRNHGEDLACRLPDGRRLAYAEYGDPGGRPLVLFHGVPSSRLMFRGADAAARAAGVRLIAPDRPGIGRSDPQPGRRIADWPADVAALADRLGLDRFAIAGVSGGAPYALACARYIPERLGAVGIVSGVGPLADAPDLMQPLVPRIRALFAMARRNGPLYTALAALVSALVRRWPSIMLEFLSVGEPGHERAPSSGEGGGGARAALEAGILEAFHQGSAGPAEDFRLLAGAWGFVPEDARGRIFLWHGEADTIVPAAMTRHLARRLPGSVATYVPAAGHLFALTHAGVIIAALRT